MKQLLSGQLTSRKSPIKFPQKNLMKRDPVIAKIWRKNKVTSKLLKIWKITIHLP